MYLHFSSIARKNVSFGNSSKMKQRREAILFICTNQQPPQRGGAVPEPVLIGSKSLLAFSRVLVILGTTLNKPFFRRATPLKNRRRAARSLFEIGRLFSLFSCLSLARLLIFLLLLMSGGNVYPNPGSIFPCSVWA